VRLAGGFLTSGTRAADNRICGSFHPKETESPAEGWLAVDGAMVAKEIELVCKR
jgi:hypothetical protein